MREFTSWDDLRDIITRGYAEHGVITPNEGDTATVFVENIGEEIIMKFINGERIRMRGGENQTVSTPPLVQWLGDIADVGNTVRINEVGQVVPVNNEDDDELPF